uniref:Uncharacterized protein n=1 Tax=Spongospora subterranea TaxID=70186 RepID=A0A0H5QIF8_9EUKA|eukprot:CRZ01845.1 hypothetical protein [Spongospora subterranea]
MAHSTQVLVLATVLSLLSHGAIGQAIPVANTTKIEAPGNVSFPPKNHSVIPPSKMTACNLTSFFAASLSDPSAANQSINLFDDNVRIVAEDVTKNTGLRLKGKKDLALFLKSQIILADLFGNTTISLNKTLIDKKDQCVVPFAISSRVLSNCKELRNGAISGVLNVKTRGGKIVDFNRTLDNSQMRQAHNCILTKLQPTNRTG